MNASLVLEFTKRDFTERYAGSVLGVLWTFIWPLVNIFIYTVIFSKIMSAKLPGVSSTYSYSIYLVAGVVPWTAFSSTVLRASSVFADKKHIISKIKIKLPLLPFYIVLSETIVFVITFFIYVTVLLLVRHPLTVSIIFLPFIYIVQQIFAYALGFLVAIFYVFLHDLREVISIVMQLWFWFTPIVYVIDILPVFAKRLFVYNPAFWFIDAYHAVFVFGKMPNFYHLMIITVIGHGVLLLAYICYKKLEKDIRDFL